MPRCPSCVTGPLVGPKEQEVQVVAAVRCGKTQIISSCLLALHQRKLNCPGLMQELGYF